MLTTIILILTLLSSVASLIYAFKLRRRMKTVRSYLTNLFSFYTQLDLAKQSDYLELLDDKQRKQFDKVLSSYQRRKKVPVGRLRNGNLMGAIDFLFTWFLAHIMHAYFATFESLSKDQRDGFTLGLDSTEMSELQSCLDIYHNGTLTPKSVISEVILKDVIEKFTPFVLEYKSILERYLVAGIGILIPINPLELLVQMHKTRLLSVELIKNNQDTSNGLDTLSSFDS